MLPPEDNSQSLSPDHRALLSDGPLTALARSLELASWSALLDYVRQLPYGRNTSRTQFEQVFLEGCGTCSTKHALLQTIAEENGFDDIHLMCGIYRMHAHNTHGIRHILEAENLEFIPEAHCYLLVGSRRIDVTFPNAEIGTIEPDLLEEIPIEPHQVGQYKIDYHRDWLRRWLAAEMPNRSLDDIWAIREKCIAAL